MERPVDTRTVPEGCELAVEPDSSWRLVEGKRCRDGAGGSGQNSTGGAGTGGTTSPSGGRTAQIICTATGLKTARSCTGF